MASHAISSFLASLPKCEHHVHIEGCLTPSLQFALAQRNNITFPADDPAFSSPSALQQRYDRFTSLDDFLHYYTIGGTTLVTAVDFRDLTRTYLERAWADGVRHAEIFFDPQAHTSRGIGCAVVVEALTAACSEFEKEKDGAITTAVLPCFLRTESVDSAKEHLQLMKDDLASGRLLGIGLDSSEVGFPNTDWKEIYMEAEKLGIRRTAHAGEEGPPEAIRESIDELHVQRVDHGVALARDEALMRDFVEKKMLLTVCPISNVKLQVFKSLDQVPIPDFLEKGVRFSINSDDPAYFGAFILECYEEVQKTFNLTAKSWLSIAENSIEGSWCGDDRKATLKNLLKQTVTDHHGKVDDYQGADKERLKEFWLHATE